MNDLYMFIVLIIQKKVKEYGVKADKTEQKKSR